MHIDSSHHKPRGRSRRALAVAGLLAVSGLLLAGCSGSAEKNFDSGFSVTAAVGQIPASDVAERYDIVMADLDGIAKIMGVERTDDLQTWLPDMIAGPDTPIYLPLPELLQQSAAGAGADTLGWNLADVDRFVTYSALPASMTVIAGDLAELPSTLTPVSDGVMTDVDGEDYTVDPSQIGAVIDRMGRPTRFAHQGNRIAMSSSTDLAEAWVSNEESLADDESVNAIAEALDAYGASAAYITQPAVFSGQTILGPDASPSEAEAAFKEFDALVPPDPYDLVGLGWAVVDGKPRWIATYHFLSDDAAKDGAQVLRAVWEKGATLTTQQRVSDLATVNDVVVKDSTVAVLLSPTDGTSASVLMQLLMQREIFFATR